VDPGPGKIRGAAAGWNGKLAVDGAKSDFPDSLASVTQPSLRVRSTTHASIPNRRAAVVDGTSGALAAHGPIDTRTLNDTMPARAKHWIAERVVGQVWWYRLPVLLFMIWVLRGYLEFRGGGSIFSGINLGFHEMGHAAFMWSGSRVLTTAGGTIFEIGIPVVAGLYLLLKQRDPFGAAFCLFWMGTALVGAGCTRPTRGLRRCRSSPPSARSTSTVTTGLSC